MSSIPIRLGCDRIVLGSGSIEYLRELKGTRAAVFSAKSIVKSGYYERITALLKTAGIESKGYFTFNLNPAFEDVMEGAEFLLDYRPDIIVAVGGGTVMDLAKVMKVVYENESIKTMDDLTARMDTFSSGNKAAIVCIPTTSGSGSEVSRSGIITDARNFQKVPIRNLKMVPDLAILDPHITLTLPKSLTAETGMDALTHLLEALVSLPKAYADGTDIESRDKMMQCSLIGGLAFSASSLGLAHAIAHSIGAKLKIPHGVMNAVLLPIIIRFNSADETARLKYQIREAYYGNRN